MVSVENNLPLVNTRYKALVATAVGATGCAAAAILAPWQAVKIIGMTVLTGVAYGIANDMIACRDCIEYFTVGHIYDGKFLDNRPLNTLNPNLNALAWGMIATWHVCAIAGVVLAFIARCPFSKFVKKITAKQLAPFLAVGAAIALLVSHIGSRIAQKRMKENPTYKYPFVPLKLQAGWEACNIRNSIGYLFIAIGGVILSIGMIAVRIGLFKR